MEDRIGQAHVPSSSECEWLRPGRRGATETEETFIELIIKPVSDEEPIKIGTAMVCSSRPDSMGIRFLEMVTDGKNRLSQVILSLLVGQSLHQNLFA